MQRLIAGAALVVGLAACSAAGRRITAASSDRSTAQTAAELAGTWAQAGMVMGSSLSITLEAHGSTVSGTGRYAMEAGRAGTLTVAGAIADSTVKLDLAFDSGTSAHFDGVLADATTLRGGMKYGPAAGMQPTLLVTFRKQ